MDKISVIVPVYKVEEYLAQSMSSVLGQTYTNLEIILVDDGSPDNCGKICDEYARRDNRVIVIHKQNGGAPAARNDALAIATGDWIAYVDPDDWIEINAFEKVMEAAKKEHSDIIIFNHYECSPSGKQRERKPFPKSFTTEDRQLIYGMQLSSLSSDFAPYNLQRALCAPWNKVYKMTRMREQKVVWPALLKANDDVVYSIHAFQAARKITYIDHTLYYFRYNPNSITHKYTPNRVAIEKDIYNELEKIKERYRFDEQFRQAMYARTICNTWNILCRCCFFHSENSALLSEKIGTFNHVLSEEPFISAFSKIERNVIKKRSLKLMLIFPKPNALWFYILYKMWTIKVKIEKLVIRGGGNRNN